MPTRICSDSHDTRRRTCRTASGRRCDRRLVRQAERDPPGRRTDRRDVNGHGIWLALIVGGGLLTTAGAQDDVREALFRQADFAMSAAQEVEAQRLAPRAFGSGLDAYRDAEADLERGRSLERIRNSLTAATERFSQAAQAAELASTTLADLIETRDDAAAARAETFAAELWNEAEDTFDAAARRLETGDVGNTRELAGEAELFYRDAELTAIKAQYLSQTRALLAQARQNNVPRFAPTTFERARALLEQAESTLDENRYATDLPASLAEQANYQARHAISLAEQIAAVRDEEISEEDLILAYEEPLERIAAAADLVARFDAGIDPVVAQLVGFIDELRERSRQSALDLDVMRIRVAELEEEIRDLDERLGGVSQERVALVQRLEAEARIREQFDTVTAMFTRDEARVLREGDDVVIRLVALNFASGESGVQAEFRGLLDKIARAASVFPRSQIIVEGHTDSYGGDVSNLSLSRRRAEAVSEYLSSEFGVPAFRISAVGYGETRPIANNETATGRARNRRIDVRIEPQRE